MPDSSDAKPVHDAGGTYAQLDLSPAAERSRFRTTQHYPSPAARPDAAASSAGMRSELTLTPGSQLDAGTS